MKAKESMTAPVATVTEDTPVPEILVPRLSDTMQEGTLARWLKQEGDPIHKGDVITETGTDKALVGLEAHEEGPLIRLLVPEGSTVVIGTPVAVIGDRSAATVRPPAPEQAATPPAGARQPTPPEAVPEGPARAPHPRPPRRRYLHHRRPRPLRHRPPGPRRGHRRRLPTDLEALLEQPMRVVVQEDSGDLALQPDQAAQLPLGSMQSGSAHSPDRRDAPAQDPDTNKRRQHHE